MPRVRPNPDARRARRDLAIKYSGKAKQYQDMADMAPMDEPRAGITIQGQLQNLADRNKTYANRAKRMRKGLPGKGN